MTLSTGDFNLCKGKLNRFLIAAHPLVNRIRLPRNQHFVVLSAIYYTAQDPLVHLPESFTTTELIEAGQRVCSSDWNVLNSNAEPAPHRYQSCFTTAYIDALFDRFHLANNKTVTAARASWTLGVALLHAVGGVMTAA